MTVEEFVKGLGGEKKGNVTPEPDGRFRWHCDDCGDEDTAALEQDAALGLYRHRMREHVGS